MKKQVFLKLCEQLARTLQYQGTSMREAMAISMVQKLVFIVI